MAMIRRTAHYAGRVQGVGFRWTTARIAGGFDVSGYVRNLPDGRVELVVEGEPAQVKAFLEAVESYFAANIRDKKVDEGPATGQYSDFRIRH